MSSHAPQHLLDRFAMTILQSEWTRMGDRSYLPPDKQSPKVLFYQLSEILAQLARAAPPADPPVRLEQVDRWAQRALLDRLRQQVPRDLQALKAYKARLDRLARLAAEAPSDPRERRDLRVAAVQRGLWELQETLGRLDRQDQPARQVIRGLREILA